MATLYTHSNSFASLKTLTETLSNNLTTSQYLQIYDDYLDRAVAPIVMGTTFFDTFVSSLLGWQERNFRRKVSFLHRTEIQNLVVSFLLQPTPEGRFKVYTELRLDRGIRANIVEMFQRRISEYIKACNCELVNPHTGQVDLSYCLKVKHETEKVLQAKTPVLAMHLQAKFWLERALSFKQLILEKYVRLCLTTAQRDYVHYFNHTVPLDDIVQMYLLAASRAIDKCDSRQGALTSHIQNWFMTGRVRVKKQYEQGIARQSVDTVDWEAQDSLEFSPHSLSDQERTIEEREYRLMIRQLAKIADPLGGARAYLGIEESLSDSELQQFTLKQSENTQ